MNEAAGASLRAGLEEVAPLEPPSTPELPTTLEAPPAMQFLVQPLLFPFASWGKFRHLVDGLKAGTLRGSNGFEENLLRQLTGLRAEYFNVGDYAAGRMPLAYVQLVQVLIDSLVLLAPFSLYPELGSLAIPATGLLTLFFKGLLELSKSFLDPFGNEGYPGQNIRVDVLVSELNFGASSRWAKAGAALPDEEGETPATTPMSLGLQ